MYSTLSTLPATKPARGTLVLLFAVFFLPFVVGTGLFWSGWRPAQFVSHGELIQPPRALPASGLLHPNGRPLPTEELLGKWLLVLPVDTFCDVGCEQNLQQMQQVHIALNKEQKRVQRVLIFSNGISDQSASALQQHFPDLVVASRDPAVAGKVWEGLADAQTHGMFVIDPMGNVMMHYGGPVDMRGVLKDLERLLRYSWIR